MRNINSIINIKTASVMTLLFFIVTLFSGAALADPTACYEEDGITPVAWRSGGTAWFDGYTYADTSQFYICTAEELNNLRSRVNTNDTITFSGKTIILQDDIDFSVISADWATNWTPIGSGSGTNVSFQGTFDGNGHTIDKLTITSGTYRGLFGYIGIDGKVQNLALTNVSIIGGTYVGGIAGSLSGARVAITNSSVTTGTIRGSDYVGGIAGSLSGAGANITNSYVTDVTVTNTGTNLAGRTGGIASLLSGTDAYITNSYFNGKVISSGQRAGGIVGSMTSRSAIRSSYSSGSVSGNQRVGGIVGDALIPANNIGTIENVYSLADITSTITTGEALVGGIAGSTTRLNIKNCYALGIISSNRIWVGGISGRSTYGSIENCVALNSHLIAASGSVNAGRITGGYNPADGPAHLANNFAWGGMRINQDENDEGQRFIGGTAENNDGKDISGESIFDDNGTWNAFLFEKEEGEEVWQIDKQYPPILLAFLKEIQIDELPDLTHLFDEIDDIEDKPWEEWYDEPEIVYGKTIYRIGARTSVDPRAELAYLANLVNNRTETFADAEIILESDIDFADFNWKTGESLLDNYYLQYDNSGWMPIGTLGNHFWGTFDGNGHVVKNLWIDRSNSDHQGLFGFVNTRGTIKNLGLINVEITGNEYVGGIAGRAGNIENSFSTGTVSGGAFVGGVAGGIVDASNSYSTATVSGVGAVGGFSGAFDSLVNEDQHFQRVYSTGQVLNIDGAFSRNLIGGVIGQIFYARQYVEGVVALNERVDGRSGSTNVNRVVGGIDATNSGTIRIINSYAWDQMPVTGSRSSSSELHNTSGTDVTANQIYDGTVWDANHANYPTDVWIIKEGKLPILRVFEEKNDTRGGESVQSGEIPDYIMAEVTPEVPDPEKSVVVSGMNRGFQIGLADEFGAWIHEPVFPDSSEIEFIVGYEEGPFTLWLGIDGVYPAVTVADIKADEMFNVGNYFYNVEIPEGVSNIRINFPADGMEYVPFTQAGNIALLKTGAEAWLSFEYNGIQYGDISIALDGSGIFPELAPPVDEPPVTLVSATPTAYVTKLNGNKNDLTVTITETYSDGSKEVFTKTFSINNNAAGSYDVGGYMVYVDTKGNTQIRECYIVN